MYFEQKKTNICNAKFGDLGANGDRGVIFGIDNLDLPIHYATFMGVR